MTADGRKEAATPADIKKEFKRLRGDERNRAIRALIGLGGDYEAIGKNAKAALLDIAKETRLNGLRVERFRVEP